jgi:hypothetical protein
MRRRNQYMCWQPTGILCIAVYLVIMSRAEGLVDSFSLLLLNLRSSTRALIYG